MDSGDAVKLITLLILLLLSAFFSSAETCLTTLSRIRVQSMADEKVKNADIVLKLKDNTPKMLSTILIGNNIVNLSASSLTTTFVISLARRSGMARYQSLYTGIGTGIITLLVLIIGEILPKTMATVRAEHLCLVYARPVYFLVVLFTPLSFLMNLISKGFMKLFHISPDATPQITENELRTFVDVSHEEGVIESEEKKMITNVVDFGDSMAKDVMVPKMDVQFAEEDYNYEELMNCYKEQKFTRMPVYNKDHDSITGVVNLKDLFFYSGSKDNFKTSDIMREPYFTYEYKKTSELFMEMKKGSIAMAIVLDEYGSMSGLLTMEDLVEEIVGEIRDEYDANEEDEITKTDDGDYILLGVAKLDDIDEMLGIHIESENYDSIAGHVISLADHFPEKGEKVKDKYAEYTVLESSNNHIDKVRMHLLHRYKKEENEE